MKLAAYILLILITGEVYSQQLTEICPSNVTVFEGPNTDFSDWLEVYNSGAIPFDLE